MAFATIHLFEPAEVMNRDPVVFAPGRGHRGHAEVIATDLPRDEEQANAAAKIADGNQRCNTRRGEWTTQQRRYIRITVFYLISEHALISGHPPFFV